MELTMFLVSVTAFAGMAGGVLGALWWLKRKDRTHAAHLANAAQPSTCESCEHFSLEEGAIAFGQAPAFQAASTFIPPWAMGRKREIDWHPSYAPLDKALDEAIAAKDTERVHALHQQINELPIDSFGKERNPATYIPKEVRMLKWTDFGVCHAHNEGRAKTDVCNQYKPRLHVLAEDA